MTFGFSVGDVISVGKLISEIVSSLQSIGGAKSEYQELTRELHLLVTALRNLDRLEGEASDSRNVDSIKYVILSCRHTLEGFLRIRGYEKSLGIRSGSHPVIATADKLRWTFSRKEEITRLQTYLNMRIGTINMMLRKHGLDKQR
jgi:hypothetical protein